jgi:hypothetical protein
MDWDPGKALNPRGPRHTRGELCMPKYYRRRRIMFWNLVKRYLAGFGLIFLGFLIAFACSYLFLGNNMALLACYAIPAVVIFIGVAVITGFRL